MMSKQQRAGKVAKFLGAAIGSMLFGQKPPKPPQSVSGIAELEDYINQLVTMSRPPGLSLTIVKEGQVVYDKSFGLADGPNKVAATPETVYQWMSMTKIITAVAIFQLQERGLLSLDDPVDKHLPFFKVRYPSTNSERVTVKHLLNHSAGLPNPLGIMGMIHMADEQHPSQVDIAQKLLSNHAKLKFEPGSRSTYTNLGYIVLGAIVEMVSGQPHKDYVVEHIFRPLKMDRTNYEYTEAMQTQVAVGSQPNDHLLNIMLPVLIDDLDAIVRQTENGRMWFEQVLPDFTGAAGVIGPANEASRFALAFLNGGELDGARILSPESIAMMTHDGHVTAKGGPAALYKGVKHGLGWWIWPDGKRQRIMHSGDGPGFSCIMQLYPEEQLGVIVQGNEWVFGVAFRGTAPRDAIAHLAASLD